LRLISDYGLHHPGDHPWSLSSMNVRGHMHGRTTSADLWTFPDIQRGALWQLQPPAGHGRFRRNKSPRSRRRSITRASSWTRVVRIAYQPPPLSSLSARAVCRVLCIVSVDRSMVGEQTVVTGACHGVISVLCVRLYESSSRF